MREYIVVQVDDCKECNGKYSEIRESLPNVRGMTFPEVWSCSYCHEGKVRTSVSLEKAIVDLISTNGSISNLIGRK